MEESPYVEQAFMLLRGQEVWREGLRDELDAIRAKDPGDRDSFEWGAVYETLALLEFAEEDGENEMLGE